MRKNRVQPERQSLFTHTGVWMRLPYSHIGCIQKREEVHIGTLQSRYGLSREEAQVELHRRLDLYARMCAE